MSVSGYIWNWLVSKKSGIISLFTNIAIDETIDSCIENLHNDDKNQLNIPKHDFGNLLNIATKKSFFYV